MEPAAVAQPQVDVGRSIVEPSTCSSGQPLSQASDRIVVEEGDRRRLQTGTAIDEDLLRSVDEHVGHPWKPQQRLQRPGADHVTTQHLEDRQDGRITDDSALCAQRLLHAMRGELSGRTRQVVADQVDDLRRDIDGDAHAAITPARTRARVSTSAAARASGARLERIGPSPRLGSAPRLL